MKRVQFAAGHLSHLPRQTGKICHWHGDDLHMSSKEETSTCLPASASSLPSLRCSKRLSMQHQHVLCTVFCPAIMVELSLQREFMLINELQCVKSHCTSACSVSLDIFLSKASSAML